MRHDDCTCTERYLTQFVKCDDGTEQEERYLVPTAADLHDCDYVASRNALIPAAEWWATVVEGKLGVDSKADKVLAWNVCFLVEMERLSRLHRIRQPWQNGGAR